MRSHHQNDIEKQKEKQVRNFDGVVVGISWLSNGSVRLYLEPNNEDPHNQSLFFVDKSVSELRNLLGRRLWGSTKIMCGWYAIGIRMGHNRFEICESSLCEAVNTNAGLKPKKRKRKAG